MKLKRLDGQMFLYICPHARNKVGLYKERINQLAKEFEINTPLRMAHFLAQVAHESAEFQYTKEIADGRAYEGKRDLGNTHPGDGVRYKGRGLIQITGRYNYEKYKKYCGFDVVKDPSLLEEPFGATRSAMWFWKTHGCNELADKDDVEAVTRRINGGLNGIESRKTYLKRAKQAYGIE